MHSLWCGISLVHTGSLLTTDDLLLALNQRAAAAAEREEAVGQSIAADGILGANLGTLEEFETVKEPDQHFLSLYKVLMDTMQRAEEEKEDQIIYVHESQTAAVQTGKHETLECN